MRERDQVVAAAQQLQAQLAAAHAAAAEGRAAAGAAAGEQGELRGEIERLKREAEGHEQVGRRVVVCIVCVVSMSGGAGV